MNNIGSIALLQQATTNLKMYKRISQIQQGREATPVGREAQKTAPREVKKEETDVFTAKAAPFQEPVVTKSTPVKSTPVKTTTTRVEIKPPVQETKQPPKTTVVQDLY